MPTHRKIIIDTDCGIDDAVAIMIAVAYKEIEILGITTVSGNTDIENVNKNVLRLLRFLGKDNIPVFRGASLPLIQGPVRCKDVHGENGFGNIELPRTSQKIEKLSAPQGLYELLKKNPGLTIITIGPLTNIAILINLFPKAKDYIGQIISMGGAIDKGNVTRFAEFNFFADPEAIQLVIDSNIPLTIIPWDPIFQVVFSEKELKNLVPGNNRIGKLFLDLQKLPLAYAEKYFGMRVTSFPDPITMAYIIDEEIAESEIKGNMKIELNQNTLRGASVWVEGERLKIITKINKSRFIDILSKIFEIK